MRGCIACGVQLHAQYATPMEFKSGLCPLAKNAAVSDCRRVTRAGAKEIDLDLSPANVEQVARCMSGMGLFTQNTDTTLDDFNVLHNKRSVGSCLLPNHCNCADAAEGGSADPPNKEEPPSVRPKRCESGAANPQCNKSREKKAGAVPEGIWRKRTDLVDGLVHDRVRVAKEEVKPYLMMLVTQQVDHVPASQPKQGPGSKLARSVTALGKSMPCNARNGRNNVLCV